MNRGIFGGKRRLLFCPTVVCFGWENTEQSGLDPDKRLMKKELRGENFVCCQD